MLKLGLYLSCLTYPYAKLSRSLETGTCLFAPAARAVRHHSLTCAAHSSKKLLAFSAPANEARNRCRPSFHSEGLHFSPVAHFNRSPSK